MGFSRSQQVALAILPKFSASASLFGSLCIIYEILWLDRRRLSRVYHRILLVMSFYDVAESSFNFMSSWPIPRGTPDVAFAVGNTAWCEAQGFVLQFGVATPMLNTCLSLYYLWVIKYGWEEATIARYCEPWFHITSVFVAGITAGMGLANGLFNNSNLWCWYAPLPLDCKDSYTYGDEANCIRGDNAWIYRWGAYYAPLWACIISVMCIMASIYLAVLRLEQASEAYLSSSLLELLIRNSARARAENSKARRVANQALCYVGAFYITFTFATINRLVQQIAKKTYFPLILIHSLLEPGQGFWNYLVYLRPRYVKYKASHPKASFWTVVRMIYSRDPERIAARKASRFVDDDHEDEEAAKRELARWKKLFASFKRRKAQAAASKQSEELQQQKNSSCGAKSVSIGGCSKQRDPSEESPHNREGDFDGEETIAVSDGSRDEPQTSRAFGKGRNVIVILEDDEEEKVEVGV